MVSILMIRHSTKSVLCPIVAPIGYQVCGNAPGSRLGFRGARRMTTEIEAGRILIRHVMAVARKWRAQVDERLRDLGMSQARYTLLAHLAENPAGLSQVALADLAGVEPASLVRLMDHLAGEGFVARSPSPRDRRANLVRLTSAGLELIAEIDRVVIELGYEVLGDLAFDDLLLANSVLGQVRAKLATA